LSRGHIYKLLNNPLYAGQIAHKGATYEGQHASIIDAQTWAAVQSKLAGNAHKRRSGTRAAEPSLLARLLYDGRGNRLSPTHAVKNEVRYRYYVSQAVLQHRDGDAGSAIRIPAQEIEELVSAQICAFLKDSGQMIDEIGESLTVYDQQRLIQAATKQANYWPQLRVSEQRTFFLQVVAGVTVHEGEIEVVLRRKALRHVFLGEASSAGTASAERGHSQEGVSASGGDLTMRIQARLKLSSGKMRLVISPGHGKELRPRPNAALIKALARSHNWKQRFVSGEAPSLRVIANQEGVTERYVGRLLRLAFLAPDIVEAILDGHQPADLDLERLLSGVPLSWKDQRRVLGLNRP
jgi:hypothetical protein